jgi:UDP-N-acetylmuramate: L-alanyl-gamma-D-glutamyl-meso-diaminopimelate ligase
VPGVTTVRGAEPRTAGFPYRRAHFIGIGGVGMSATAKLLRDSGVAVTGSDEGVYPPISDVLRDEGIDYRMPYDPANIPADVDLFVIGKNARLVPQENAEVAAAVATGRTILSFAEVIGLLSQGRTNVVVAGSFGKTTSTALLAHCLTVAERDPSYMIGAVPLSPPAAARIGAGDLFLVEGDEYPSSNTDDRSKFLHYHPAHLIIAPLAHDHVNVFPTVESYLAPFRVLVDLVPPDGSITIATSGELSGPFLAELRRPVTTYGVATGEWHAERIALGERSRFSLMHGAREVARVETGQLGLHNIENMVGVGAFAIGGGFVTAEQFATAIASFRGIRRRLDRKTDRSTIPIFEGFGSSVDKARSAITAMRQHFPGRRLVTIFEPHTFSWRNRATLHWYDTAFQGCGKVFVWHPATQGAQTHEQVTQAEIVGRIAAAGFDVEAIGEPAAAIDAIGAALRADDAVLLLTSGHLGGLIEAVPKLAEERFPA